jgi:hypothetical protein
VLAYAGCYILLLILGFLNWHGLLPALNFGEFTTQVSQRLDRPIPILPSTGLGGIWTQFSEDILIPLFGAVGTMTTDDIRQTPLNVLLEYVHSTVGTWHYSLGGGKGARDVADRLCGCVREQGEGYVRLGEEIVGIRVGVERLGGDGGVRLGMKSGEEVVVDRVVFATQASAANKLLGMVERGMMEDGDELERIKRMRRGVNEVEYRVSLYALASSFGTRRDRALSS